MACHLRRRTEVPKVVKREETNFNRLNVGCISNNFPLIVPPRAPYFDVVGGHVLL